MAPHSSNGLYVGSILDHLDYLGRLVIAAPAGEFADRSSRAERPRRSWGAYQGSGLQLYHTLMLAAPS